MNENTQKTLEKVESKIRNKHIELNDIEENIFNKVALTQEKYKCPICTINVKTHLIYPFGHKCLGGVQ